MGISELESCKILDIYDIDMSENHGYWGLCCCYLSSWLAVLAIAMIL